MEKINAKQINSIRIVPKRLSTSYVYREEVKKTFFGKKKEAGFYYYDFLTSKKEIEEGDFLVEGKEVFNKPYVEFIMINKNYHRKHFNSEEEITSYLEQPEFKRLKLIVL